MVKSILLMLWSMGLAWMGPKRLPLQAPRPVAAVPTPLLTAAISLDRLLWLREQRFPAADRYLQNRGWKFISKQKEGAAQDARYAYTLYKWAYSNPDRLGTGDTLVLATSRFPLEMGMLHYNSPSRGEYDRVWAAVRARHFAYSSHSGPARSSLMIFEGSHQDVILSIRPEEPGQRFQIGIEYRDPKVVEFLPPPMPPKRAR